MRTFFALMFVLLCAIGTTSAQDFDQRLLAGFTQQELEVMQAENPDELAFWEFYLENGFVVEDAPQGKGNDMQQFEALVVSDWSTWNVLEYYGTKEVGRMYYSLDNGTKLLVLRSLSETKRIMQDGK